MVSRLQMFETNPHRAINLMISGNNRMKLRLKKNERFISKKPFFKILSGLKIILV